MASKRRRKGPSAAKRAKAAERRRIRQPGEVVTFFRCPVCGGPHPRHRHPGDEMPAA